MAEKQTFESLGRIEAIRQLFEGTPYQPFGEPCFFASKHREYITSSTRTLAEGVDYRIVGKLVNTDLIMKDSLWIGLYPGMGIEKLNYMVKTISEFCHKADTQVRREVV